MYRTIITLLCVSCLSNFAYAEDIPLQKNHPEQHVVVKGDTLWGIAGQFLQNPWQWPKLWNMNREQIKNPHRIYPGDVVVLDTSGTNPQFKLLRETVTLKPGIIEEPLAKEAIYSIPPNVIGPFLTQPLLVEASALDKAPRIIGAQDDRLVLSPGTRVYISSINPGEKTYWNIYRPGVALKDPDTNEVLGIEAIYLGDMRITKFGSPASADIVKAKEEIFTKDRLVVASEGFRESFVPHAPENQIQGRIIKIYGGVAEAGPKTVVAINRGKNDGLEEGHVLAISRRGHVVKDPEFVPDQTQPENKLKELNFDVTTGPDGKKIVNFQNKDEAEQSALKPNELRLPDERVGLLMVFRTFDKVSYGLIMRSSDSVFTLDSVHTP